VEEDEDEDEEEDMDEEDRDLVGLTSTSREEKIFRKYLTRCPEQVQNINQ